MSLTFDDAFTQNPVPKPITNSLEELCEDVAGASLGRRRGGCSKGKGKERKVVRKSVVRKKTLKDAFDEYEKEWMEDIQKNNKPQIVVEGLVGKDDKGVSFAPQKYTFVYNGANTDQAKKVHELLEEAKVEWGVETNQIVSRFRAVGGVMSGDLPSVCAGLSAGYKTKSLPAAVESTLKKRKL